MHMADKSCKTKRWADSVALSHSQQTKADLIAADQKQLRTVVCVHDGCQEQAQGLVCARAAPERKRQSELVVQRLVGHGALHHVQQAVVDQARTNTLSLLDARWMMHGLSSVHSLHFTHRA
jgi:hypothetical protein